MDKNEFRKILQIERKRKGLTQEELAKMTGFTKRAIQYWEAGKRSITLEHADVLFKALNITVEVGKEEGNEQIKNRGHI